MNWVCYLAITIIYGVLGAYLEVNNVLTTPSQWATYGWIMASIAAFFCW